MIHPTAIIDSSAQLGENVKVGPWSQIGADVKIGDHCEIASHAVIKGPTIIGENNFEVATVKGSRFQFSVV